jgi:ketosteroid isomerase-like protein
MKKIALSVLLTLLMGPLFGQMTGQVTPDDIESFIESYYQATAAQDMDLVASYYSDDALFCGTDPSEYWDKNAVLEMFEDTSSGDAPDPSEMVKKRVIHLSANKMSAVVVEHLAMPWSPNIPVRQTIHVTRNSDKWQIDFIGWSFIAPNDDIGPMNAAVGQ